MTIPLLTLEIFLPLVGILILMGNSSGTSSARWIALVISGLQLVLGGYISWIYLRAGVIEADKLLSEFTPWFQIALGNWGEFSANYSIGIDGLSLPLIWLSLVVNFLAVVLSWKITDRPAGYFSLLLLMNTAILGTFMARDFLLFYLFFEFMLLPMFFLIGLWGGKNREYASIKFFLYTLAGSLLILAGLIVLYLSYHAPGSVNVHTFEFSHLTNKTNLITGSFLAPENPWRWLGLSSREWVFLLLTIGFLIKLPTVPLHTWLPDAHVEAPTPVSVILAALLLKIGGYGLLRIVWPIFPEETVHFAWLVGLLGVVSILYGALNALAARDLKVMIAYSSVSHMGFVMLGLASFSPEGLNGSIFQMVSHGILAAMLFALTGVLYDRTGDRMIGHYSGLASRLPRYFIFVAIAFFAALGLPGFSGFIGEMLILLAALRAPGLFGQLPAVYGFLGLAGLVLGAAYFLWALQRMFLGKWFVNPAIDSTSLSEPNPRETFVLVVLAGSTLLLGLFPAVILERTEDFTLLLSSLFDQALHLN